MTSTSKNSLPSSFEADDAITMDAVWNLVGWGWRRKYFIVTGLLIGAGIGLFFALTTPKSYKATVRLIPAIDSNTSFMFSGISALGMGLGPIQTYEPVFEEILFSDSIISSALEKSWVSISGSSISLSDIYSIVPESDDEVGRAKSMAKLNQVFRSSALSFKRDQFNGFMELTVELPKDPQVASDVANFIVASLQDILVQKHDLLAESREVFLQNRFMAVTADLLTAEEVLAEFEKSNRNYYNSPPLKREHARLQREVDVYSLVWSEIQKQIELAKISNQHGQPRVVVVDEALPPVFPSGPKRRLMVIVGMFTGFCLAVLFLAFVQVLAIARSKVRSN